MNVFNVESPVHPCAWSGTDEWEPTLKLTATTQMICILFAFLLFSTRMLPVFKENHFSHPFQYPVMFLAAFYALLHFWNYTHYFITSDPTQRDVWLVIMIALTISKNVIYLFLMLRYSFEMGFKSLFYLFVFDTVHLSQWAMTALMLTDIHVTPPLTNGLSYTTFGERGIIALIGYNLIDAVSAFAAFFIFWRQTKPAIPRDYSKSLGVKSQNKMTDALSSVKVLFGSQLSVGAFILLAFIFVFFVSEFVKVEMGIASVLNGSTDTMSIYLLCVTCYTKLMPMLLGAYLLVAITAYASSRVTPITKILAFVSGLCTQAIEQQFITATQTQNESLIKRMIHEHPTLRLRETKLNDGNNVLHIATTQRNTGLLQYWMSLGLSPDEQNHKGDTALHIASRLGDVSCVSLLMERGADATITNKKKQTAQTIAQNAGYTNIIKALSGSIVLIEDDDAPSAITRDEVSKHNNKKDGIWLIINQFVYDVTEFVQHMKHPAGKQAIKPWYGKDASEAFEAVFHSKDALKMLKVYEIGRLQEEVQPLKRGTEDIGSISNVSLPSSLRGVSPSAAAASMSDLRGKNICVSRLFVYPVKGCGGFAVDCVQLTQSGVAGDRIYGFVNRASNTVINQLTFPRLALIEVAFKSGHENCDEGIELNEHFVPFIKEKAFKVQWRSCTTPILVWDQGEAVSKWITAFLKPDSEAEDEFIFVRLHEDNRRETEEYFALPFAPRSSQTISGFQNYASVLLGSEESLAELNRRYLEKQEKGLLDVDDEEVVIEWDRFRMNIIVSGVPRAHYEDFMKQITFGDEGENAAAQILWSRRRYYCATPSVNQKKGIQTMEPISTCRRYRNAITLNDRTALPGDDAVFFGSFYGVKHSGRIRVGQSVFCCSDENSFAVDYLMQYEECELILSEEYSYNVVKLRLKMRRERKYDTPLKQAMKMGDHYSLKYVDARGVPVIRPYTPLFDDNNECEMSFDLMIKVYEEGLMSNHLKRMQCGDTILCKQNRGKICYTEPGQMLFDNPQMTMFLPYTLNVNKLNLIAAGSGITPIYQIISNIHLNRKLDHTKIVCFYANVSMEDILLRDELIQIARSNPNICVRFVVEEVNERDMEEENVHSGRISSQMCHQYLFPPHHNPDDDVDVVTLLCGPPPMEKEVVQYIYKMGHHQQTVSTF